MTRQKKIRTRDITLVGLMIGLGIVLGLVSKLFSIGNVTIPTFIIPMILLTYYIKNNILLFCSGFLGHLMFDLNTWGITVGSVFYNIATGLIILLYNLIKNWSLIIRIIILIIWFCIFYTFMELLSELLFKGYIFKDDMLSMFLQQMPFIYLSDIIGIPIILIILEVYLKISKKKEKKEKVTKMRKTLNKMEIKDVILKNKNRKLKNKMKKLQLKAIDLEVERLVNKEKIDLYNEYYNQAEELKKTWLSD